MAPPDIFVNHLEEEKVHPMIQVEEEDPGEPLVLN